MDGGGGDNDVSMRTYDVHTVEAAAATSNDGGGGGETVDANTVLGPPTSSSFPPATGSSETVGVAAAAAAAANAAVATNTNDGGDVGGSSKTDEPDLLPQVGKPEPEEQVSANTTDSLATVDAPRADHILESEPTKSLPTKEKAEAGPSGNNNANGDSVTEAPPATAPGEAATAVPPPAAVDPPQQPSPPPVPEKHPVIGRLVEQSKILPNTGQYYPLQGTIVDYLPEDGRIPSRFVVQYNHDAAVEAVEKEDGKTTMRSTTAILQDEWVEGDLTAFEASLVEGTNPSAVYNRYTTTSNRLKTQSPGLKLALTNVEQRYNVSVEHTYHDSKRILSILVMMAALEESLQSSLQRYHEMNTQDPDENSNDKQSRQSDMSDAPKYYTTNPSVYLLDPSKDPATTSGADNYDGPSSTAGTKTQMTPQVLAQRVRQGCQWAWTYLQAQQQGPAYLPPPPVMEAPKSEEAEGVEATASPDIQALDDQFSSERRRSSRAAATVVKDVPAAMYNATELAGTRRSTRSADTNLDQPVPTPVHHGGRVALWWLKTLQNGDGVIEELIEHAEEEEDEEEAKEKDIGIVAKDKKANISLAAPEESEDGVVATESYEPTDEEDEENEADNDDEDFNVDDTDDNDDEDLEGVERERQRLSPVPVMKKKKNRPSAATKADEDDVEMDDGYDDEDSDDDEEEEIDEEDEIVYNNPYLRPSLSALLEILAGSKSISMEDIQSAMADVTLRVRHNKRFSEFGLIPSNLPVCDQIAIGMEDPDHPSSGSLVLKCVSGDKYGDLQRYDASTFSRCRFELDVIGEMETVVQVQRREAQLRREVEYKERKAWDKWRYRGIQEGYCTWPEWNASAVEWVSRHIATSQTSQESTGESNVVDSTNNDEALAKSLEENDGAESGSRRRNTRRAAASATDGVFYGNQSQLTLKQLVDALLRLIKSSTCQTLMKLLSTVADDSNDPMRRCRMSIGKMLWKRNLVSRKSVTSRMSDAEIVKALEGGTALLSLASTAEGNAEAISTTDADDFTAYMKQLHLTEIYLREIVLENIGSIPIPIIACAADERPGSMENMDRSDFDESANINWKNTDNVLIGKKIYRPPNEWSLSTDMTECYWYTVKEYSEAIESEAEDTEEDAVERRMRFRAVLASDLADEVPQESEILLLTEAQVYAGIAAADLELKRQEAADQATNHAFASSAKKRENVVLVPIKSENGQSNRNDIHGQIVGHNTIVHPDDPSSLQDRILILPSSTKEERNEQPAFWAVLGTAHDGSAICTLENDTTVFAIENSNYGPDSEAYQMCEEILEWLRGNPKIGPFLFPVDPEALGIPTYFDIIKTPMDMSTIADKLEKGIYSNFTPSESRGKRFPVSLMTNGPFRDDVEVMFDNAMWFNPEDDWIHKAAKSLKQGFIRKLRDITTKAEAKAIRTGGLKSLYIDEDSDFEMQEVDDDEEYGKRGGRKRKRSGRGPVKDEPSAKAIEHPIKLQNCLRGGDDLRGPFARLPVITDANSFSLSEEWTCRRAIENTNNVSDNDQDNVEKDTSSLMKKEYVGELEELLALHHAVSEDEASRLRRSTRAHDRLVQPTRSKSESLEYVLCASNSEQVSWQKETETHLSTRFHVEISQEKRHEEYYSKLYQRYEKSLVASSQYGRFSPGSFPPYLGRVIPRRCGREGRWEIRSPFVVPALRWVVRGLIQSGHLTALEPMTTDPNSGLILTNDIYYIDSRQKPFEVLDTRELQRKKRSDADAEESEEEVELSEYEQLRAERMARNQERLRMLGLA